MVHALIDKLRSHTPVITDGAWGTQLQARGLPIGQAPDLWNLSRPDAVVAVGSAYVAAGSRIILTNTFGGNRIRLADAGGADRVNEINRAGVLLSRQAAGDDALVFASIGPSGKLLPAGEISEEELAAVFAEQVKALAAANPDGLVVETMQDLTEALIALAAAKATGLPVVVSMSFDSGPKRDRTIMGTTPEQAATALCAAGADVVGGNCGRGIEDYADLCARLKSAAGDCAVWVKPNAGLPSVKDGKAVYDTAPEDFASHLPDVLAAGANFVGGCCGTTPDFIRALANLPHESV